MWHSSGDFWLRVGKRQTATYRFCYGTGAGVKRKNSLEEGLLANYAQSFPQIFRRHVTAQPLLKISKLLIWAA
jgi:hypothetical protein